MSCEGPVFAVLDDRELRLERLKWLSQSEQLVRQRDQAMAKRDAAAVQIFGAQVDQSRAQVALLDDQLSRTRVVAPFDGSVVIGDLSQSIGAPSSAARSSSRWRRWPTIVSSFRWTSATSPTSSSVSAASSS